MVWGTKQSDGAVVIRIQLGTGEVLAKIYNYIEVIPSVMTGPLQSVDKDTIVVDLMNRGSTYTDTSLSILEVIPAHDGEPAALTESLFLYGENEGQEPKSIIGTLLEYPIITGTKLIQKEGSLLKELKIPLLNVNDKDSPFYVTVKWEDGEWIVQNLSDTDYHEETVKLDSHQPDISSTLFSQMPDTFYFLSGAGGWQTQLYLKEDGSFTGIYHDFDAMGDPQKNPNGTIEICEFSGTFTQPQKVDDYTYSVHVQSMEYAEADIMTYKDGYRYITVALPYGLDNADEVLIYLPGYPVAKLPEQVFSWIRSSGEEFWSGDQPTTLPFYALNNVNEQKGFSSKSQSDQ